GAARPPGSPNRWVGRLPARPPPGLAAFAPAWRRAWPCAGVPCGASRHYTIVAPSTPPGSRAPLLARRRGDRADGCTADETLDRNRERADGRPLTMRRWPPRAPTRADGQPRLEPGADHPASELLLP